MIRYIEKKVNNINIDNVIVGNSYKNWKELCSILDIKYTTGKGKQFQLQEFERFFEYEKQGNKFIITSKRDVPLEKLPRGYNPYGNLIDLLLLDLVSKEENDGRVYLSTSQLLFSLAMINNNYSYFRYNIEHLHKITEIERLQIIEWYSLTHNSLRSTIESTLNRLRNKSLILHQKCLTVCRVLNGEEIHDRATKEEIEHILVVEGQILEEMEIETIGEVIARARYTYFINRVNSVLLENYNIKYYYNSYEITLTPSENAIKKEQDRIMNILTENERAEKQRLLNNKVIEKMDSNTKKRKLSNSFGDIVDLEENKFQHMLTMEQKNMIRMGKDYIENGEKLNRMLLDIHYINE